jgi:hypothetical protein
MTELSFLLIRILELPTFLRKYAEVVDLILAKSVFIYVILCKAIAEEGSLTLLKLRMFDLCGLGVKYKKSVK